MSSGLLNAGRLERKFIYESSGDPNEQKLRYNDPSFISFRILFDFEPIISNDEVTQGLLLSEERDESAISYLRRMGEKERGESLKEFGWLLSRISNDFPWFFKSVSGLDTLWKWGHPTSTDGTTSLSPAEIIVSCYETVDLRMTALADLYRKSTWDRRYFRNLLTIDKRRFNMTVILGEARKLKTFIDPSNTEWLDHVSAVAFRCLDCEFDFSDSMPANIDGSEAPTQISPSFKIKINRVQETNSYRLLNYMLGEMTRDLIIVQGGSGAEVNTRRDIIDYRSLLAPLIRSYEGNYDQLLSDSLRLNQQLFTNNIGLILGDRTFALPRDVRQRFNNRQLDASSKETEISQTSDGIIRTIEESANIINNESVINFGRPSVETELIPSINMDEEKIQEDVPNQVNFVRPKIESEISDFSFSRPKVDEDIDENVNLQKPQVESELITNVDLATPTVNDDNAEDINFRTPGVDNDIPEEVNLTTPTVNNVIAQAIDFNKPTVSGILDSDVISFGRPTVTSEIDDRVAFSRPQVEQKVPQDIQFLKPKVEEDFES
jgi:hypothetical protein